MKEFSLKNLQAELRQKANKEKAEHLKRFFKTGKGEYGEGDLFYGITVPELRTLVKVYRDIALPDLKTLIQSPIHEERLITLLILVDQYKRSKTASIKKPIYQFYINNMAYINNWDLVDLSSHQIVGDYLFEKDRSIMLKWAKNKNLWARRIAIVSTYYFIYRHNFQTTLDIAEILLTDKEDLIHKAVGWMLREVGKRDIKVEEKFLKEFYSIMPRTMLRYAIERFPENKRVFYMKK